MYILLKSNISNMCSVSVSMRERTLICVKVSELRLMEENQSLLQTTE